MILSPVTIWKKFDLTQELDAETEEEALSPAGFCVQSVVFRGRVTGDGERVKIYARFTRPCGEEKAPALLLLPDALETGEELADYFALRGYATLIPDYCGKRAQGAANEKNASGKGAGETEGAEKSTGKEPVKARYTQYPACVAYADYENAGALDRLEGENVEQSAWFEWA
ncbi:MAG: hypothetical protein ACI4RO_05700, partial [Candidatus Scatosoma sp.]